MQRALEANVIVHQPRERALGAGLSDRYGGGSHSNIVVQWNVEAVQLVEPLNPMPRDGIVPPCCPR